MVAIFEFGLGVALGNRRVRRKVLPGPIFNAHRVSDAIEYLQSTNSDSLDSDSVTDEPVFVFSAGWGTGSTLLQRLIISSQDVLVWGEPYDQAAPIQRLADSIAPIRNDWPPEVQYTEEYSPENLARAWIANLIPPLDKLKAAHRSHLTTWLSADVANCSYKRWGLKEVRLTIDHARYLRWLFPRAKFLFIYRDLYACYLSCRNKPWLSVWPDHVATNIISFAHHWNLLLQGFLDGHQEVDGLMVKYEDLVSGEFNVTEIENYLGIAKIDKSILGEKVGGRSARRHPLILPEKLILDSIAGDLRTQLGYR